ncbi:hypothetical protein H7N56_002388, partial [Staphylococcus pseudintermedius]|nr:hypothetical protein [Staphylococcus pseudintermedius]
MKEYNYWKKILKAVVLSVLFLIFTLLIFYFTVNDKLFCLTMFTLFTGAIIPEIIRCIVDLTDNNNWKASQRKLKRAGMLHDDTLIRI